jgi:hypothetical protein
MTQAAHVTAISRQGGYAILDDGAMIKFHAAYDEFGEETDDLSEAVTAIAPLPDGTWIAIDFRYFDPVVVN